MAYGKGYVIPKGWHTDSLISIYVDHVVHFRSYNKSIKHTPITPDSSKHREMSSDDSDKKIHMRLNDDTTTEKKDISLNKGDTKELAHYTSDNDATIGKKYIYSDYSSRSIRR